MGKPKIEIKSYNPKTRKISPVKRTIKCVASCKDKSIHQKVLSRAPDSVIKAICNAALNAQQGDVHLSQRQKRLLSRNRQFVNNLTRKEVTLKRKRKHLVQQGGSIAGLVLPVILSAVISAIGGKLFSK